MFSRSLRSAEKPHNLPGKGVAIQYRFATAELQFTPAPASVFLLGVAIFIAVPLIGYNGQRWTYFIVQDI
jgi:hypothetical protein